VSKRIEGLVIVYANTHRIDERASEDPVTYPWKLYANFRPPEFMQVTWVMLHGGSEEIVLRAKTRAAIEQEIRRNEWRGHTRLRRLVLTHPDGTEEKLYPKSPDTTDTQDRHPDSDRVAESDGGADG